MTYIDSALLDFVEWFCHGFQRLTGRTNVWLAMQLTNLSIIVYFATAVGYLWLGTVALRIGLGLFCVGLFYLLTQTIFKVPVEAYENSAYQRVAKGLRNPRRVRDALLRILFLTLSLVLAFPTAFVYLNLRIGVVLLTYSLIVLTTVLLYLLACDPLPPRVGKVTEWLRGSAASRVKQEKDPVVTLRSQYRPCLLEDGGSVCLQPPSTSSRRHSPVSYCSRRIPAMTRPGEFTTA